MSKHLMLTVGPPGSGKSTFSKKYADNGFTYINQDLQGREHLHLFDTAISEGKDIIVDRMNFSKQQRARYIDIAKKNGYETAITVFHEPYNTCLLRCVERKGHATIKDETNARSALNLFFSKYERVCDNEVDTVQRLWPEGLKPTAIICDLDGTLCNVEHRRHFVRRPDGVKKDWKGFFDGMVHDTVHMWCSEILSTMSDRHRIVLCSGRPDNYKKETVGWLQKNNIEYDSLFMRMRNDQRQDDIVKEMILDFEILTRFTPHYMIDDRQQVVDMWRKRGYTCLQCDEGNF